MGDTVNATGSNSIVYGGDGDDTLSTQGGTIYGGGGSNTLSTTYYSKIFSTSDNDEY